jgi:hypothetical protein
MSRRRTREIIAELDMEISQQEANLRQLKLARDAIANTIPTPKFKTQSQVPDPDHPDVNDLIRWLALGMPPDSTPEEMSLALRDVPYPHRPGGIPEQYSNALTRFRHLNEKSRVARVRAALRKSVS